MVKGLFSFILEKRKKIFLVVFSVVITIAMLEICLRFFSQPKYFSRNWVIGEWYGIDRDVIFISHKTRQITQTNFSAITKKPIIVTLGDSFTEGAYVPTETNFSSVLEESLKKEGKDVAIINLGVGGFGSDQEFLVFKKFLEAGNRPSMLIWTFYPNDIYENQSQAVYTLDTEKKLQKLNIYTNWIYIRQIVYNLIPLPRKTKEHSFLVNHMLSAFERLEYSSVPGNLKNYDQGRIWSLEKMETQIAEMKELSRKYNFSLQFALIAPQREYLDPKDEKDLLLADMEAQYQLLKDEPHFIYLNFNHPSAQYSTVLGASTDFANEYFHDGSRDKAPLGDRHFNERGHYVFAEILKEEIIKSNLIEYVNIQKEP